MSRLTDFYRGTGVDAAGRTLAELWAYSHEQMEDVHDFIQWLFPLREPSQYNPDAPLVTQADVDAFRDEPALRANLLRSFETFLDFLGLHYDDSGWVVEGPDFQRKAGVWRHPNHNWLRITRVLASTRLLGLDEPAAAFFAFLTDLRATPLSGITDDTYLYWQRAANS